MKKKIIICIAETIVVVLLSFHVLFLGHVNLAIWRRIINIFVVLLLGFSGFFAAKLSGYEIEFKWNNSKQYFIGLFIAILLATAIGVIPTVCGFNTIGGHEDFKFAAFTYYFFYFIFLIGPVEEMIFRVYYQKFFVEVFANHKWIGVIVASFLFGLWHIINGSWIQVLFTFGIGLVFGFAKEYLKDINYPGVALSHGVYDFLLNCLRFFLV